MNNQRIAFVHDRLYYIAGAEQVFFDLIATKLPVTSYQLPVNGKQETENGKRETAGKVFVMFSDKRHLSINGHQFEIVTALPRWIFSIFVYFDKHKTPLLSKLFDYRNLMFWYPVLIWILQRKIKKFQPDDIHISSFAVAKNISTTKLQSYKDNGLPRAQGLSIPNGARNDSTEAQKHRSIVALHAQSPFMYIHNHYQSNLKKLKFPIKQLYQFANRYLKPRDLKPRYYDKVSANSHYTAGLIEKIYGFSDIAIDYPKLNPLFFSYSLSKSQSDYFIFIGRLVCFSKQVDIIIQAFNQTGHKLKIIGAGPDEQYLKSIAGPNIEFLGWISDPEQRCLLISHACALVNITLESFGYVTAEGLCLGVPIIGYNQGATPELVGTQFFASADLNQNNVNRNLSAGILIKEQTIQALIDGIHDFQSKERDHHQIAEQARYKFQSSTTTFQFD